MGAALLSGLLAGYGIAMPVGAISVFLVRLGATACLCIGVAAGLGAATVDGGYALTAVAGGTGFARQVHAVAGPLHWAAGALLTVVAAWMAVGAVRRYRSADTKAQVTLRLRTPLRAYTAMAGITVVYPLTVVYWVALILGRQATAADLAPAQAGLFVLAVFAASASWQLLLVSGGTLMSRAANGRRATLAISLASALLITALAACILSD